MLEVFDKESIRRILHMKRRLCLTSIQALLVQMMRRWFSHVARRPDAHTASHVAQSNWRPAEDVGNHNQGRSGIDSIQKDRLWEVALALKYHE